MKEYLSNAAIFCGLVCAVVGGIVAAGFGAGLLIGIGYRVARWIIA